MENNSENAHEYPEMNDAKSSLLEVYLEHCASIEKNIDRRLATNRFNVSIVTALAAVGGLVFSNDAVVAMELRERIVFVVGVIAFIVSVSWFFQIMRFREVSRVKHEVAIELERKLAVRRVQSEAVKFEENSMTMEQTLSELLLPASIIVGLLWVALF